MTAITHQHKKPARALQKRTGWTYTECLRVVRTMTPEAIESLIAMRGPGGQKE